MCVMWGQAAAKGSLMADVDFDDDEEGSIDGASNSDGQLSLGDSEAEPLMVRTLAGSASRGHGTGQLCVAGQWGQAYSGWGPAYAWCCWAVWLCMCPAAFGPSGAGQLMPRCCCCRWSIQCWCVCICMLTAATLVHGRRWPPHCIGLKYLIADTCSRQSFQILVFFQHYALP
jgi:hypothetical protein